MTKQEKKDIQEFNENGHLLYRGYGVHQAWKKNSKHFKNPISGHEWSEPQDKKGFYTVQYRGSIPIKKTATGYSSLFTGGSCTDDYNSIKAAKDHIDCCVDHQNWLPLCPREVRWVERTNREIINA